MTGARRTVLLEPNPGGHRFQWVSHLARHAAGGGDVVVLLTSRGAAGTHEFATFLADADLEVREVFDEVFPSPRDLGRAVLDQHRVAPVDRWVVMDSDQMLKRWWRQAPRALRRWRGRPEGILLMTRFPPRIPPLRERRLLAIRLAKAAAATAALVTGAAQRVAYVAARDQASPGWLFVRARDPALCVAHSRDREAIRARFGLPQDRRLVAVLGLVDERKNVPLVAAGALLAGPDVDLLLAGGFSDDVRRWLDALPADERARVHTRDAFLSDDDLDAHVAASDVVAALHLNPGPSGIMGKAQVAGVPSITALSDVRRLEAEALGSGIHVDATPAAVAAGILRVLAHPPTATGAPLPVPTAEEFSAMVLDGRWSPAPGSDRT